MSEAFTEYLNTYRKSDSQEVVVLGSLKVSDSMYISSICNYKLIFQNKNIITQYENEDQ